MLILAAQANLLLVLWHRLFASISAEFRTARCLAICCVVVAACSVQLSPEYDSASFQQLTDLNVKTETLFASLAGGSSASKYPDYSKTYDDIIGGFSAVRTVLSARPAPGNAPVSAQLATSLGCTDAASCIAPTVETLQHLIEALQEMRDVHRTKGFTAAPGGYKLDFEAKMKDILAFEAALKR